MKPTFACIILLFFTLFNLLIVGLAYGQNENINEPKKHTVYAEFLGNSATILSFHYDRRIKKLEKGSINFDLGLGYEPYGNDDLNPGYGIPVSFNWTNGLNNNHFEMGIGLTYNSGVIQERSSNETTESMEALWASCRIGYKYQKPEGGLFLRIGFTPLLRLKQFSSLSDDDIFHKFLPLFGIGAGLSF